MKPAWSEQFDRDRLKDVEQLDLPHKITREWAWGDATGAGVKVAVIDSGVDPEHPAVGPITKSVFIEHDPNAENEARVVETEPEDVFGHGTACAGIIRKAAPECEIYSIRVLGALLTAKGSVFAAGLKWAVDNGIQVANMSLSTKKRDFFALFHELVDQAYFKNVMLVSAINNV
ncbi:MAG TPA: S8 family serine peptidase, partial [Actinomycetota bacterium]|nr:S8 family serine peptidase [Actinomycetota bacterium]